MANDFLLFRRTVLFSYVKYMQYVQVNGNTKTFTFLIKCAHTLVTVASAIHVYTQITGIINLIETTRYKFHSLDSCKTYKTVGGNAGRGGVGEAVKGTSCRFSLD